MIDEKRPKVRVVEAATAEEFEKELNAALAEVTRWKPSLTWNNNREQHCVYIEYTEWVQIPEDVRDEYILKGRRIICGECPWYIRSDDRRIKYMTCAKGEPRCHYTKEACLALYEAVERGEVQID